MRLPLLFSLFLPLLLAGCDDDGSVKFVGSTEPVFDGQSITLHVGECTEAEFQDRVTTQGAEDDNMTLHADEKAVIDDATIASVEPTGRTWAPGAPPSSGQTNSFADDSPAPTFFICGRRAGTAILKVYRGVDMKSSYTVVILARR